MADNLPINIIPPVPQASASFNFEDIAEGTGVTVFFGCVGRDAAAATYFLTSQSIYSLQIEDTQSLTDGTGTFDKTFALSPFNLPRDVKGTMIASIPISRNIGVGTQQWRTSIVLTLIKNSTNAATVTMANYDETVGVSLKRIFNVPLVIPLTHYKRDDVLKVQVAVTISAIGSGAHANTMEVGHDPQGRDAGVTLLAANKLTTKMAFYIPFRIEP